MTQQGRALSSHFGRKILMHIGALVSLAIVCGTLWVLYRTLHRIDLSDILETLQDASAQSILLAFGVTIVSYFVLTGYDTLALNHINRPLPYPRAALASFVAYAFGNNIGFSLVTGASIRYRIYTPLGLSAMEIAAIAVLCAGTFALGTIVILALGMLFHPAEIFETLHLPGPISRTAGIVVLALAAGYLLLTTLRPITIRTQTWSIRLPSPKLALAQLGLAAADLTLVATVLYVLLPAPVETSFLGFLTVFVLALVAGTASHVPGGIGVFETVLLFGLPGIPPGTLLGAVLLFRVIYYLMPLGLAAILFASHEVSVRRDHMERARDITADWLAEVGPQIMSVVMILAGVVLLFSGAIPLRGERLAVLEGVIPLWLLETAHMLAALAGVAYLMLGHSIGRGLAAAHRWAVILLGVGIVAALLEGLNAVGAGILAVILGVLLSVRAEFRRRGSLSDQGYPAEWISTLTVVLAVTVWLGLFSYKHIPYSNELWWSFAFDGNYSRFLRSTLAVFLLAGGLAIANLLRSDPLPELPQAAALERARRIIKGVPDTRANLALLGDKCLLFSASGNAFIMYRVRRKSWVALGGPVGPAGEHEQLVSTFRELCDRYSARPVFYLVDKQSLSLYVDLGLSILRVGDDARVPLDGFSFDDVKSATLRRTYEQVRARQGIAFEIVNSRRVPVLIPELKAVSDAWLAKTKGREKGFSGGVFDRRYLENFPCALVRIQDRIVAFATLWASGDKEELALDLMRYHPDAPAGIMDFLLVELMLGGRDKGYRWFNLGVAPLTTLERQSLAPLWHRIGELIYRQSEHFRNIENLRRYEQQFNPVWRPLYLAAPGGINTPRILRDIAKLIEVR